MADYKNIKNIIFDLGAVIINIDFNKTFEAFADISNLSIEEVAQRYQNASFFADFEKGFIGNFAFIEKARALLNLPTKITDQQIVDAWNALLLDVPMERIKRIQSLASTHRVFLLSNTNPIHISEVQHILFRDTNIHRLEELFEKTWYSYDLGLIKPYTSIYEKVLSVKSLRADETIFLDDNLDNINGALEVGITALHVTIDKDFIELLKHA